MLFCSCYAVSFVPVADRALRLLLSLQRAEDDPNYQPSSSRRERAVSSVSQAAPYAARPHTPSSPLAQGRMAEHPGSPRKHHGFFGRIFGGKSLGSKGDFDRRRAMENGGMDGPVAVVPMSGDAEDRETARKIMRKRSASVMGSLRARTLEKR
jgi:hypothetical protein